MEQVISQDLPSTASILSPSREEVAGRQSMLSDCSVSTSNSPCDITLSHHRTSSVASGHSEELLSASLRDDISSTAMMADVSTGDAVDEDEDTFDIFRESAESRSHTLPASFDQDHSEHCRIFNTDDVPRSSKWSNFKKVFHLGAAHNMHAHKGDKASTKASKYSQCRPATSESATQTGRAKQGDDGEGIEMEVMTREGRKMFSWSRVKSGLGMRKHLIADEEKPSKPNMMMNMWLNGVTQSMFPKDADPSSRKGSCEASGSGTKKEATYTLPRAGSTMNASGVEQKRKGSASSLPRSFLNRD